MPIFAEILGFLVGVGGAIAQLFNKDYSKLLKLVGSAIFTVVAIFVSFKLSLVLGLVLVLGFLGTFSGDYHLSYLEENATNQFRGLVSFFIGYGALTSINLMQFSYLSFAGLAVGLAIAFGVFILCFPKLGTNILPIGAYLLLHGLFFATAIMTNNETRIVSVSLLLVSDAILFLNMFYRKFGKFTDLAVLATYYGGLFIYILSV